MLSINQIIDISLKGVLIIFVLVIVAFFVKKYLDRKRFTYDAEIYEQDNSGNIIPHQDKFGINIDKKTNQEMGFIRGAKDVVGLDKFSYQNVQTQKGIVKLVRLMKIGAGSYVFLKPKLIPGDLVNKEGRLELTVTREDVDWAINTYIRWTKVLQKKDRMREILSIALIGTAIAVVFVVLILLIKNIPAITDALVQSSASIRAAAQMIKDAAIAGAGVLPA
jgi:hypothetical protein